MSGGSRERASQASRVAGGRLPARFRKSSGWVSREKRGAVPVGRGLRGVGGVGTRSVSPGSITLG